MSVISKWLTMRQLESDNKLEKEEEEDWGPNTQIKLEEAADVLAELGVIHNTPKAKQDWIYS